MRQSEKAGLEIDQGLFFSACCGNEQSGPHLCHAMLLPRPEAQSSAQIRQGGHPEFPGASIERRGKAGIVTYRNPRFLNAEDQTTLDGMETCVDLALLDPQIEIAVLRGGPSSIRNTRTAACSAPASISRTSITARFRFSGTWSATWAT